MLCCAIGEDTVKTEVFVWCIQGLKGKGCKGVRLENRCRDVHNPAFKDSDEPENVCCIPADSSPNMRV